MTNKFPYNLLLKVFLLTFFVLLSACTSLPVPVKKTPPALVGLPYDAMFDGTDIIDIQLALGDRNLYLTSNGNIKILNTDQCKLDISAHRGSFKQPESSARAISSALKDNFNSVEIDIMQLKDGTWVNHHDSQTGRATVYYSGERFKLNRMSLKQFAGLKLRDKKNHDLLHERPITAYEAFRAFAKNRKPNQKLNIEIKSPASGQQLSELDSLLRQTIGLGSFYYSADDFDTLYKLRGINPSVYLGFIQGGHPSSIDKLRADLRQGVKNDAYYIDNQNLIELVGKYGTKRYRARYKDYTSSTGLSTLVSKLGTHSGLHLDIRSYMQNTRVKSRANELGMKIYTYSLNGTDYHQAQLLKLKTTQLPDGVIVDATPYRICQQLFTAALPAKRYQPLSTTGRYIASLPDDTDFDRLNEMLAYQHEGYYLSLASGLKIIKSNRPTNPVKTKMQTVTDYDFPIITDEKIETYSPDTIILILPSSKDD
jgi:glycerophosphoryl diester phosphodiesterase